MKIHKNKLRAHLVFKHEATESVLVAIWVAHKFKSLVIKHDAVHNKTWHIEVPDTVHDELLKNGKIEKDDYAIEWQHTF